MHSVLKKVSILVLVVAIFLSSAPIGVFAQTVQTMDETVISAAKTTSNNQATAYREGSTSGGSTGASSATASAGTCVASTILNTVVKSAISSLVNKIKSKVVSKVKEGATTAVTAATSVTVNAPVVQAKQDTTNDNIDKTNGKLDLHNNATVGNADETTGIFDSISWDSMAYCIVNSLVEYVANSTIAWANTGFNGSPSFISNTDNFFENIADTEAGNFINSLAGTVTGGGVNLCSKLNVSIQLGLSNYYSKSAKIDKSSCTLTKIVKNVDSFMDGNFEEGGWTGWFSMTQNASNNRIGATILATDELYARISAKNNTAKLELGLNNGFLNYKKCDKKSDGTTDEKSCKTLTPGTVIQSSLEKSLNLPKDRLVLAQKFDQVIESVVNNLIKVALDEVLTSNK